MLLDLAYLQLERRFAVWRDAIQLQRYEVRQFGLRVVRGQGRLACVRNRCESVILDLMPNDILRDPVVVSQFSNLVFADTCAR